MRIACTQETAEMGLDPEFLAALPPEIQAEVLQQQRTERRRAQVIVNGKLDRMSRALCSSTGIHTSSSARSAGVHR